MEITGKTCNLCNREESTHGGNCLPCHAVILALCVIRRSWGTGEYADLGSKIKSHSSFLDFKRQAISNHSNTAANLGDMLFRLAHLSGVGEERFKAKLFWAMDKDRLEMESCAKQPGGIEAWRDRVGREMAEASAALILMAKRETATARIQQARFQTP